jgi:phosphatidylinositol kinase/protein kinase (PI-3  family)
MRKYDSLDHAGRVKAIQTGLKNDHDECDLARAILVTSANAMSWIHRSSTFANSVGVLAMISYVFGFVDTTLSGILIDKETGSLNYSRFTIGGRVSPVPFRLTRVIVAALGIAGVDGPFMTNMTAGLNCMRKHAKALALVLPMFFHKEPYDSPRLPRQYMEPFVRVSDVGDEIDEFYQRIIGEGDLGAETRALIEKATSKDNMAEMPGSWLPWW